MISPSGSNKSPDHVLSFPLLGLLAIGAGAIYPLAFAPFHWFPLLLVSVALFWWLLNRASSHWVLLAWTYGLGKYGVGISWVYVSIHQYGGASPLLAGFLVTAFVALMALFCLPIGWFVGALLSSGKRLGRGVLAMAFVAAWLLMEWLLTWFLTGFPWLFAGHAMLGTPLQGFAPVFGELGVTLVAVLASLLLQMIVDKTQITAYRGYAVGALLLLAGLGMTLNSVSWVAPQGRYDVALVQGNIDQAIKWEQDQRFVNVRKHMNLSAGSWDADVLIWPEAALTLFGREAKQATRALHGQGRSSQTNVIVGMPDVQRQTGKEAQFFNTVQGFGLAEGRFAKHHLVPFGEYVPLQDYLRGLIEFFDLPMSVATSGPRRQPNIRLQLPGIQRPVEVASGICYEVAYGDTLRGQAATSGVLLTVSNDTWFGGSIGPHQHMQIAQMRALENGRWLLRATNNGVTGVVNERGEIMAQLPQFEPAVLRAEFAVMLGTTPYAYLGNWPVLGVVLIMLLVVFGRLRRAPPETD